MRSTFSATATSRRLHNSAISLLANFVSAVVLPPVTRQITGPSLLTLVMGGRRSLKSAHRFLEVKNFPECDSQVQQSKSGHRTAYPPGGYNALQASESGPSS